MTDNLVEIRGGCRTVVAADEPHDVTFTSHQGLLLAVTPDGRLVPGSALSTEAATQRIAARLVEYFGYGYGSRLREAEERADKAEASVKRTQAELRAQKELTRIADTKADKAQATGKHLQEHIEALEKRQEKQP